MLCILFVAIKLISYLSVYWRVLSCIFVNLFCSNSQGSMPLLKIKKKIFGVSKEEEVPLCVLSSKTSLLCLHWEVTEPPLSSLRTTCHCSPRFPKDYCCWLLPFNRSQPHSHRPWSQSLAGQSEGNCYSFSNPYPHILVKKEPMRSSRSSHFFSVLFHVCFFPCRFSCITAPFSLLSRSKLGARLGHEVLRWRTEMWTVSKRSNNTSETYSMNVFNHRLKWQFKVETKVNGILLCKSGWD